LNYSVFPCQYHSTVALHTHISSEGWTIGPLVAAVQRHSLIPSTQATTTRAILDPECLTSQLTNFMEQSPSWEANSMLSYTTNYKTVRRFTKFSHYHNNPKESNIKTGSNSIIKEITLNWTSEQMILKTYANKYFPSIHIL
jgi:hypothetical protein